MKARSQARGDAIAELKMRVIRQQELAAKLVRQGKPGAAAARAKLLVLLNQLDVLEHCSSTPQHGT
jgi:hypothetical protein